MRHPARLGAFLSGLALYSAAMLMVGALADKGMQEDWFDSLGGARTAGQVLSEALIFALPLFLLALGWSYLTVRPQRRGRPPTTGWCLGGLGLAWFAWLLYGAIDMAAGGRSHGGSLTVLLLSPLEPPLWGLLNGLALLAGVLIAGLLVKRQLQQPSLPPTARG